MRNIDSYLEKPRKVSSDYSKVILIDFDGVLHNYSKGFYDGKIYDGPQPGAKESLKLLKNNGFKLICFSARISADPTGDGKEEIRKWLKKYDMLKYIDDITDQKTPSVLIIDDSAVRHENWNNTINFMIINGFISE